MGRQADAGAAPPARALRQGTAAQGPAHGRVPAYHLRDRQPAAHAEGRRRRSDLRAPRIRSRRRTTSPPRSSIRYGIPTFAIHGEDRDTYYSHLRAVLERRPTDHDGRRRRPRQPAPHRVRQPGRRREGQHGGDDHRRDPAARDGERRRAQDSGRRRQRRADQASVRQSLRHRTVDARRHHPRHRRVDRRLGRGGRAATASAAAASRRARAASAPTSS